MTTMNEQQTRDFLLESFEKNRQHSRDLFAMIPDASYYERPIPLRHPFAFYEGHFPAFNINTLAKKGHGVAGIDEAYEELFERGIDPEDEREADGATISRWPTREQIASFGRRSDELIRTLLREAPLDRPDRPAMNRGEAAWNIFEHELMHHETLLYIFHALDPAKKQMPELAPVRPPAGRAIDHRARVFVPAGTATLGADREAIRFGWDNEFDRHEVEVGAFEIDVYDVTNGEYLDFVEAGGYRNRELWTDEGWEWLDAAGVSAPHFWLKEGDGWKWRAMLGTVELPLDGPVWVTHAEATAYARWKNRRLMTEAEYHRAAFGTPQGDERQHPWGDEPAAPQHGNFGLQSWDPLPVGSFPAGRSAWGVEDLAGNGWEWTSTEFAPFDGFRPMPSYDLYSIDFFDGRHYVMKGASPATPSALVRPTLRNWFRPTYPWVWASFRTVETV